MARLIIINLLLLALNNLFGQKVDNVCRSCRLIEYLNVDSNNVEVSEMRNELLFEIIQEKDFEYLLNMAECDSVLQHKIQKELSAPVNDTIDLKQCKVRLQTYRKRYPFVDEWLKAIEIGVQKYDYRESQ